MADDNEENLSQPEEEAVPDDTSEISDAAASDSDGEAAEEDDSNEEEDEEEEEDDDDDESVLTASTEGYIDHYDESTLPPHACRYCGIHSPASVARCVETDKWFCNAPCLGGGGSHLVHHLVRSRSNQVQLHPESPLGDTVLECYNCASKNSFVLGFVPASASSVVVLLCRVCVETVPALKDMDWELSQWHPLVQDRKFLPWLVTVPADKLQIRAREITGDQITKLEELWKSDPTAGYADLDRPDAVDESELSPTLLHYEDGYHYQNVLAPLVKMEADYDKQMKESLTEESISVRWEKSLTGRNIAVFTFSGRHSVELSRVVVGDELRLKLGAGAEFLYGKPWEGMGYVKDIVDGEVELEIRPEVHHKIGKKKGRGGGKKEKGGNPAGAGVPEQITDDYIVEYIWKSTSFDRMQNALKVFAIDDTSVTGYIYHKLLGHPAEEQLIANPKMPDKDDFTAPGLPPLNESQVQAVASVLQRPMSLIQGKCAVYAL